MSISELINQYGIGMLVSVGLLGILIIIGIVFILWLIWMLFYVSIIKSIEHDYDIDFELLSCIQVNHYKLETKVDELKSCQLSHCCQNSTKQSGRK